VKNSVEIVRLGNLGFISQSSTIRNEQLAEIDDMCWRRNRTSRKKVENYRKYEYRSRNTSEN
jgi:hypothetical protein